jgi:hypothetical protein
LQVVLALQDKVLRVALRGQTAHQVAGVVVVAVLVQLVQTLRQVLLVLVGRGQQVQYQALR